MTEKLKDFVKKKKKPSTKIPTVADEIKRLNKNEKYKIYYENKKHTRISC